MKSIRFELPVLVQTDVPPLLDLATRVNGVIAACVQDNTLHAIVADRDSGHVLREELRRALAADAFIPA